MWDRIFMITSLVILSLAGALLASSALDYFFHFSTTNNFLLIRSYFGKLLVGITVVFAILNMRLTSHPMYESWVCIMVGGIIGAVYWQP